MVTFIEEHRPSNEAENHVFKLTDLKKLYHDHVKKIGGDTSKLIHSTRLVQKLQDHIPTLQSHNSKSGPSLSFKKM